MRIRNACFLGRRVDFSARPRDDLPIPEVIDQCRVVGVEQARAARQGERKYMQVVRFADSLAAEFRDMIVHCFVRHRAGAAISQAAPEPLHESPVLAQLLSEFAADYQLSAWARQPIEESLAGWRSVASEYFECHVGINDSAHYSPIDRRVSSMKNWP